jgi:FeS assembly SUF system protein
MTEKTQRNQDDETPDAIAPGMEQSVPGQVQTPGEAPAPGEPGAAPEPAAVEEAAPSSIPPEELERLREDIVAGLKTVFDPEIPVDIYELGLIYRIDVDDDRNIEIDMTLTAPGCPVAGDMPGWVENAVSSVPGVGQVKVNLTFDPPWDMSRMSDEARLALNMF